MPTRQEFRALMGRFEDGVAELDLDMNLLVANSSMASFGLGAEGQEQSATIEGNAQGATQGTASANAVESFDDALAYGLLLGADLAPADPLSIASGGDDVVTGQGSATGTGKAESRGVSFGVNAFSAGDPEDPDEGEEEAEEDFGPSPEDFLDDFAVTANFGAGNDRIEGQAVTEVDATDPEGEGYELVFAGANGLIVDRDSVLRTGPGQDRIIGTAELVSRSNPVTDNGRDGNSGGDADLEVIADGIENVGLIGTGIGNDVISGFARADAVGGATAIADGIDNSSVGNENAARVNLNLAAGADRIEGTGISRSKGDGALANGWDNRATALLGDGDDTVEVSAMATFIDDATAGDQEEAIADGQENRGSVFFGRGDDTFIASAKATGNGVLTIADGIDSRGDPEINNNIALGFGAGDDTVVASGVAVQTEDLAEGTVDQSLQRTVASGMLNQNVNSPRVLFGDGDDRLEASGRAEGDDNATFAAGVSNISFDLPNPETATIVNFGRGDDTALAEATASSGGDVVAFGWWGGFTALGHGNNTLEGRATITEAANAHAHGLSIDDDIDLINGTQDEDFETSGTAKLTAGSGGDQVSGFAEVSGASGPDVRAIGIFVGSDSAIDLAAGEDVIEGGATLDGAGEAFGIFGEAGAEIRTRAGDDRVLSGEFGFGGGFSLQTGLGNDFIQGFGEVDLDAGAGIDTLDVTGFGAFDDYTFELGETGVLSLSQDGVVMTLNETVEIIAFDDMTLSQEDLVAAVSASLNGFEPLEAPETSDGVTPEPEAQISLAVEPVDDGFLI
ncbi:MAG: hypothetical protein AAFR17_09235 [Pseudomonadota bacterium]